MPTAMEFLDSDKISSGERSNFTGTCSLLRKYLLENGSVGDLTLGLSLNGGEEASKGNPVFDLPAAKLEQKASEKTDGSSLALFPQHACFGKNITENSSLESQRMGAKEGATRSQMTIFYGGRMAAFDDVPVEKVEAIMQFMVSITATKQPTPAKAITHGDDLSLKRKASFQRFLQSRKDRLGARAPCRVNHSSPIAPKEKVKSEMKVRGPSESTIPISFGL